MGTWQVEVRRKQCLVQCGTTQVGARKRVAKSNLFKKKWLSNHGGRNGPRTTQAETRTLVNALKTVLDRRMGVHRT